MIYYYFKGISSRIMYRFAATAFNYAKGKKLLPSAAQSDAPSLFVDSSLVTTDLDPLPDEGIYYYYLLLAYSPVNRSGSPQGFSQVQISYTS